MAHQNVKRVGFTLAVGIVWAFVMVITFYSGLLPKKTSPGLKVLGTSVALKSESDLQELIKQKVNEIDKTSVTLIYKDKEYKSTLIEIGYELDQKTILERIVRYGNKGNVFNRIYQRIVAGKKGYLISVVGAAKVKRTPTLEMIESDIGVAPTNAHYELGWGEPDKLVEGKSGRIIDTRKLGNIITRSLLIRKFNDIHIPTQIAPPRVELRDIEGMTVLSEYSTKFDPKVINRVHNMQISVDKLNGQFIESEGIWSLNGILGPREINRGYREAIVILEGKFVPGIGGGVSQVTTTTYNAALLAGLAIKEHFSHTIPITYVPFGLDATAVYGEKDLKLYNPYNHLISMSAGLMNDTIKIKFFGFVTDKLKVALNVNVDERYEPNISTVQDDKIKLGYTITEVVPVPGYRISVDRSIEYAGGKKVFEKAVATGWYRTINGVIRVGINPEGIIPTVDVSQEAEPKSKTAILPSIDIQKGPPPEIINETQNDKW